MAIVGFIKNAMVKKASTVGAAVLVADEPIPQATNRAVTEVVDADPPPGDGASEH